MTQEEKQLLLVDLCARLPYNTRVHITHPSKDVGLDAWLTTGTIENISFFGSVKPYLRPMSSMTEEEIKEERRLWNIITNTRNDLHYIYTDFLLSHHFDYRGLISMGLAIEVTEENNPYN